MTYEDPACADCPSTVRACAKGEAQVRGPGFCPSKIDPQTQAAARDAYDDPEVARMARTAALIESEGYCRWPRALEIVEFAKRMGYQRIGIASCVGLLDLAGVFSDILKSHGFTVISVCCKNGSIPKEEIGVEDAQKVRPGGFEAACNPVAQAELLNAHGAELNVVIGLCVGHDTLFYRYAKAPTTTLVTKDRVLGHNPAAALMLADTGYYSYLWGEKGKPARKRR